MTPAGPYRGHEVRREDREDGSILLSSGQALGPVTRRSGDWLHKWAGEAPGRVFLAERSGAGWRGETYADALEKTRALAASLLARGLGPDRPILVISGNGVDHGLLMLAAQYAGVPLVPLAEQYALIPGAHGRLRHAAGLVRPGMVYAADADRFAAALALDLFAGVEIVASRTGGRPGITPFADLLKGAGGVDVDAAFARVTPATVAKILMTSGSTSAPKGVLTTQAMMCANQAQIAAALPLLEARPPRILDWLPWNHVFGGSHNFNMMLAHGGSLYIDDGKPVEALFGRMLENLSLITFTLFFNVPVGFAMMLKALETDPALRKRFFGELDLIFYAGASLPGAVWEGFERMAKEVRGEVPLMISSWGMTETAPAAVMQHEPTRRAGVIGVPLPGVTVKLLPAGGGRHELRVKGPNVTPGYFRAPEKTRAAFDAEGFLITGDAVAFRDPKDPARGLVFEGRIGEDFKLLTGTWVHAARLRLDLMAQLAPLAADLVITGADRGEVGVMIFPDAGALARAGFGAQEGGGALSDPPLLEEIRQRLASWNRQASGSSTRIARAVVLAVPPSMPEGEMTAKGNLNFRRVLERRADLLARLYGADDPAIIRLRPAGKAGS